jgi:hypothetical protein
MEPRGPFRIMTADEYLNRYFLVFTQIELPPYSAIMAE